MEGNYRVLESNLACIEVLMYVHVYVVTQEALRDVERAAARQQLPGRDVDMEYLKNTLLQLYQKGAHPLPASPHAPSWPSFTRLHGCCLRGAGLVMRTGIFAPLALPVLA